jgi:hypothetical protein
VRGLYSDFGATQCLSTKHYPIELGKKWFRSLNKQSATCTCMRLWPSLNNHERAVGSFLVSSLARECGNEKDTIVRRLYIRVSELRGVCGSRCSSRSFLP